MKNIQTIAVIGGNGKLGHYLVDQLLSDEFRLKLLIRNPALFEVRHPGLEIVRGDAVNPEAVRRLLAGSDAVINLIGQRKGEPLVAEASVANVLEAMKEQGQRRYIGVTGLSLDTPDDRKSLRTRLSGQLVKWLFPATVHDKQKAYLALLNSEIDWTLVRIPMLKLTHLRSRVEVRLEDCPGNKVSSSNVAAFLTAQLHDLRYLRKAPFLANCR